MKKSTILIVEDQEKSRKLLCRDLQTEYEVLEAINGKEAITFLQNTNISINIVLVDIVMSELEEFDVLDYMQQHDMLLDIAVVALISKATSTYVQERAIALGASDVIEQPYNPAIIRKRLKNILELKMKEYALGEQMREKIESIIVDNRRLRNMNYRILAAIGTVVEFRNMEFSHHILRIQEFTRLLLECIAKCYPEYQLTKNQIDSISYASALHDIGKIAIPDSVLLKPGRLTTQEYQIMKMHTIYGSEILQHVASKEDQQYMKYALQIVRWHHERYDGTGYPDKLAGDLIPFAAQIVSVADVYDALVSEKVYKAAYPHEEAFRMILDGDCGVFNPKILLCFKIVREEFQKISEKNRIDW